MRRRGAEDVELDKITPVRILWEASASESRFLRLLPRVFPIRRPSFPRFLRPFFIILARTMQRPTGSSERFVMREKEIERDRKRKKYGAKEKGTGDLPVSSKRFERNACYVLARFVITRLTANRATSRNRARERAKLRGHRTSKRKPNAVKRDKLMN